MRFMTTRIGRAVLAGVVLGGALASTLGGGVANANDGAYFAPPVRSSVGTVTVNDTDPALQYAGAGWNYYPVRGIGDIGDDVHATTIDGDSVAYPFYGTGITYVTERSVDEGQVSVAIDGVARQSVDAHSIYQNLANQALYTISGLPLGNHSITLTKAGGTYMLVDAFIVETQGRTLNDTDPAIHYVGFNWFYVGNRPSRFGDADNDVHATTNNTDTVDFPFNGTAVSFIGEEDMSYGTIDVYLDGVWQTTLSAQAPVHNLGDQVLYNASNLARGSHVLSLIKKSGQFMVIDGFSYQP